MTAQRISLKPKGAVFLSYLHQCDEEKIIIAG
jgi:hypothetical protein